MITEPNASLKDSDPDVGLFTVLRDDGSADPAVDPGIAPEVLMAAYRHLRRLRLLDARMILLQRQGRVGFYGACTGQEAVPIATGLVAKENDWVFPALREQSVMLVRGFPLKTFIAQVFGNGADVQKGRQMPSHQAGKRVHQVSWSSCIGPQVPQAVGTAHAMKLKKEPNVAFGFCGDGATSQPDFHIAMHFAATFQVPAVLICQNNHWSISVPTARQTAARTIAVKGRSYGIPSVRVDGNDLLAMMKVLSDATARARSGGGPTFIEALTYRIGAHSTSDDPTRYRSDAEVESWKKKDPVDRLQKHLRKLGLIDDAHEKQLEQELTQEIAAAVNEVEAAGPPVRESLFDDVYARVPLHLEAQKAELMSLPPAPSHG
ncbi:MAG: Branched-chain alpha-keto acid dehydrogenase, component, alpha subunit [Labilithrix sp.]|nr:Branched-chain alpha-keto acid dehydrogenase, component, alpha subunit [Labilithrix sp.]